MRDLCYFNDKLVTCLSQITPTLTSSYFSRTTLPGNYGRKSLLLKFANKFKATHFDMFEIVIIMFYSRHFFIIIHKSLMLQHICARKVMLKLLFLFNMLIIHLYSKIFNSLDVYLSVSFNIFFICFLLLPSD